MYPCIAWSFRRLLWCAAVLVPLGSFGQAPIIIADFEGPDYGDWVVQGNAFGVAPAQGTLPNQNPVSGFEGKGLVNSFVGGDGATGMLRSPVFTVDRPYLNVLVGGGAHAGQTCLNLYLNGEHQASLRGRDNEQLEWRTLDLTGVQRMTAAIEIVDNATGGWGHINVDHIELSDTPRAVVQPIQIHDGPTRTLVMERPYLHLPVKNGAPKLRMRLRVGDQLFDEFDIELAATEADFQVFVDLSRHLGQSITVELDAPLDQAAMLDGLTTEHALLGAEPLYRETYRPQFHFSPRRGWNNDPNGLVYFQGEYHLYFQHNPCGWNWGNMHWGHAVSRDLVHWEELPVAVYPHAYGDWAFSGSGFIDWRNSGGFKQGPEPPLVIAYTSTGRGECIAYSNDRGRTFTEYEGNPVVKHPGRDPKVLWHEPSQQWVMAVYDEEKVGEQVKQAVAFYTSPNLKEWTLQSKLDGYFECPELFQLPVDGNPEDQRWVVYAANNEYAIGQFDGKKFTPDGPKLKGNHGNCLYAAQTFSDIPRADGRRIEIGWGQAGHPSMPFNQQMLFPTALSLQTTPDGIRLFKEPVWEIASLHETTKTWKDLALVPGENPLAEVPGELLHIQTSIAVGDAASIAFELRGTPLVYDAASQTLSCGEVKAPLPLEDGMIHLEILVDRLTIEAFGNLGLVYMPVRATPDPANRSLGLKAEGGTATIRSLAVHTLKSAW